MRGGAPADARARPPVLLLTGVGLTAAVALRSVGHVQGQFEVLAADDLSITSAGAAVALLDGAGVDRAHVIGVSFGGVIAQQLAATHPERVSSLVLGSSSAGGESYVPPERAVRHFLRRLGDLPPEEGLWAAVPYLYAEATYRRHAQRIGEDIARRLSSPLDTRAYGSQYEIARAHDAARRLARITAPTLVVHGEQDRIVPVDNGRLLARGIARARLVTLSGGAHAFLTDVPDAGGELLRFLLAHSLPQEGPASKGPVAPKGPVASKGPVAATGPVVSPRSQASRNARAARA